MRTPSLISHGNNGSTKHSEEGGNATRKKIKLEYEGMVASVNKKKGKTKALPRSKNAGWTKAVASHVATGVGETDFVFREKKKLNKTPNDLTSETQKGREKETPFSAFLGRARPD